MKKVQTFNVTDSLRSNQTVTGLDYCPTILVADSAVAITKGYEEVFEMKKRIYCWFHVKKAISKQLNSIPQKKIRDCIEFDIIEFQHQKYILRKKKYFYYSKIILYTK